MRQPDTADRRFSAGGFGLTLLDALFVASLLFLPVLWMASGIELRVGGRPVVPHWKLVWIAVPPALLALRFGARAWLRRTGLAARGLLDKAIVAKLCLATGTTFAFFVGFEQVLEKVGYERPVAPIVIRGEDVETSGANEIIPDNELRWKFSPGGKFRGRQINRLGFLDREVDPVKAPGTIRVICMGDSCTAQGSPPYSGFLNYRLTNAPPAPGRWEAFNMGVHGYSSVQGLRLFELKGSNLAPDVVTLYFGWNDHWAGGRLPDAARMGVRVSRMQGAVMRVLGNKRFGQLLLQALAPALNPGKGEQYNGLRVPQEDYRKTLTRFVALVRAAGGEPILITAPRAKTLTQALVRNGQGNSVDELIALHDQYAQITREVAAAQGVRLLDLHRMMSGDEWASYFERDGIHLVKDGRRLIAEELHAMLGEMAAGGALKLH